MRVKTSRCPECHKPLDAATGVGEDDRPSPGCPTFCMYCCEMLVYADDLSLKFPSDEQLAEWKTVPKFWQFLTNVQAVIRRKKCT